MAWGETDTSFGSGGGGGRGGGGSSISPTFSRVAEEKYEMVVGIPMVRVAAKAIFPRAGNHPRELGGVEAEEVEPEAIGVRVR